MNSVLIAVIFVVLLGSIFDFTNGFHDTANTVATSISTGALTPRIAIALAAVMNFVGALTFTGVAQMITSGIVDPFQLQHGSIAVLAALIAAIGWNLITWYFGIPSSSTHAIIGSIVGAVIAAGGFHSLHYKGFAHIVEALVISPIIAIVLGFIIMSLFRGIFKDFPLAKTNKRFRLFQIFTAAVQSFAHGTNDAQKTMGIITLALIAANLHSTMAIPMWVRVLSALAMGLGTSIGGLRIIKTVGKKIMKIRPVNGASADLSSAIIILGFTKLGLPVSSTHVISSSIMGVGAAKRLKGVNWSVARRIVITWVITLPVSACIAWLIFKVIMFFS
jgi:PiT family inorganic phosphate transporter